MPRKAGSEPTVATADQTEQGKTQEAIAFARGAEPKAARQTAPPKTATASKQVAKKVAKAPAKKTAKK